MTESLLHGFVYFVSFVFVLIYVCLCFLFLYKQDWGWGSQWYLFCWFDWCLHTSWRWYFSWSSRRLCLSFQKRKDFLPWRFTWRHHSHCWNTKNVCFSLSLPFFFLSLFSRFFQTESLLLMKMNMEQWTQSIRHVTTSDLLFVFFVLKFGGSNTQIISK